MADGLFAFFKATGLDDAKAKKSTDETLKNNEVTENIKFVVNEAGGLEKLSKAQLNLLYTVASKLSTAAAAHRALLAKYIAEGKIKLPQIGESVDYLNRLGTKPLDVAHFESECGVGVEVTEAQIDEVVAAVIAEKDADIKAKRAGASGILMTTVRQRLKWADGKLLSEKTKAALDKAVAALPPAEAAPAKKEAKPKEKAAEKPKEEKEELETVRFPMPEENTQNAPELLEKHLKTTGGKVVTRFPPEPNGYLHIGHAKAMHLDFGYARKHGGICIFRYDDTNPETEKDEYIRGIDENVRWLGHVPDSTTFSSEYFDQLYDLGVELIRRGKAYVDHQKPADIKLSRKNKVESPWRNRPIEESLKCFDDMRKGKYAEGEATLRMKMNMQSDNPCMRDLVAFRVKFSPHPHVGDKWCVYPSYDFTHCIVDSIENVTHSLCTLEYLPRRETYYWLLDALGLYKPLVWEYARLKITHTVLSKRRLIKLVEGGYVRGWDDPRLPTIIGLRRRGFTAASINNFCEAIGVTTADNTEIEYERLESSLRADLDDKAPRAMAVLNPLKITFTNFDGKEEVPVPIHPKFPERGTHKVVLAKSIFIDTTDFREDGASDKSFYGLAPGKSVGLKYTYDITCTEVVKDASGHIVELKATLDKDKPEAERKKTKGHIHWVADPALSDTLEVEVRLYDKLFKSKSPTDLDEWLADLSPDSLVVLSRAYVTPNLKGAKPLDHFQFERVGFFVVDADSTDSKLVINRSVSLKESYPKFNEKEKAAPAKKK